MQQSVWRDEERGLSKGRFSPVSSSSGHEAFLCVCVCVCCIVWERKRDENVHVLCVCGSVHVREGGERN